MNLEKTIKKLENRGFTAKYFPTAVEAADYLEAEIQGKSVGIGGSITARDLGLYERLAKNNTVYGHWQIPGAETIAKANAAEVYITSANAITEDGEILNIDGRGNRLAAQVYGDKKVYYVAGVNKICPDFATALDRARNVASVKNAARFELSTPCQIDGKCHDCRSPQRICNALIVHWAPMMGMEAEVVLIGEDMGY